VISWFSRDAGHPCREGATWNTRGRVCSPCALRTLDDLRASGDYQVFQAAEKDESVIGQIVSAQREGLEKEIGNLEAEAERVAEEARELAGDVPF